MKIPQDRSDNNLVVLTGNVGSLPALDVLGEVQIAQGCVADPIDP